MTVESASYISQLDTTLPTAADLISEGDDHLRLTKTVLKTQFPNFGTTAITASAAEVNYSVGVTSAIQTQLNGKGAIAGQAWTGAHSFAGATSVPTLAAGSNTTGAASTAFVQADFLQKFPKYTAPVNASTAELNYLVGLTGAIQPQLSNQVSGPINAATAKSTPADADELGITDSAASWGLKKLTFANLKAWIGTLFVSKSGDTMTGPLAQAAGTAALPSYTFSGDANTGVWSPAADVFAVSTGGAERLRINASGKVGIGTSAPDSYVANTLQIYGASSSLRLTDEATGVAKERGVEFFISGGAAGILQRENAYLTLGTNSLERLRLEAGGNVLVTGGGALGYGVGAGGTVTQATDKGTAVTLNKPTGQITMNTAALGAGATVQFTLNNTLVAATDTVVLCAPGSINYQIWGYGALGAAVIYVKNISGASLSDSVAINFAVVKGATS